MKEQIKTLAVKVFGMTDGEVQSLFKTTDDGETLIENFTEILSQKDRERISRIHEDHKTQLTEVHDKGYKKAQKEVMPKFEQQIKEKYGYNTDKFGIELIDDLVSMNKGKGGIEDIKTHPEYIKLERKIESEFIPKTMLDEKLNEFENFKKTVEREKVVGVVKEDARKVFRSLNPSLSKDPKRAANQEAEFIAKLESFDFQVQPDGNHVIMKDGKRLENENFNPIGFHDFIKAKASDLYDFAEQAPKGNSGIDSNNGQSTAFNWKDFDEFKAAYNKETDIEKRTKMFDAAKANKIIAQ
jgi:hypothetical protein